MATLPGFMYSIIAPDTGNCRCVQQMRERRYSTHVKNAKKNSQTEGLFYHFYGYGNGAKEISSVDLTNDVKIVVAVYSLTLLHGCADPCVVPNFLFDGTCFVFYSSVHMSA